MQNFWQQLNKSNTFLKRFKVGGAAKSSNLEKSDGGFWKELDKPIFCLAPMEEVTDVAFREMFAKYGKPDVMFTEFVNVDGLLHPEGFERLKIDLAYTEVQRPMVAQIWGRDPEKFEKVAAMLAEMGFDGIDINMGCPQDREIKLASCAALIREPKLAQAIIAATKKGAGSLPVSVKTRLGYSRPEEMEEWLKNLLEVKPAVITMHARTKQEKSKVPAHWEKVKEAVEIRNSAGSQTLILGNGDIKSREEGLQRIKETGADGVMVGRGAFGNPWFFRADNHRPDIKEKLRVMLEHAELFNKLLGERKSFIIMRKHFKAYVSGFDGAAELRAKVMETKSLEEVRTLLAGSL